MPDTGLADSMRAYLTNLFGITFDASGGAIAAAPVALTPERLARLRATFDLQKLEAPEVAIRTIGAVATELEIAAVTAADHGIALDPDVSTFKSQVDRELAGLKSKAETIATGHVTAWQTQIDALTPPPDTAKRAGEINQLLLDIEPGLARDTHMLKQVGGSTAILASITTAAAALKEEYKTLIPARATRGDPIKAVEAGKPASGLGGKDLEDLTKAMKDTQALMGREEPVDLAVVNGAVALIKKGLTTLLPEVDPKVELGAKLSWVAIKEEYHKRTKDAGADAALKKAAEDYMAKMWWYRRQVVDETMAKLQDVHGFTWGSVGSDNPESDYDLTIRTHGTKGDKKRDFEIVAIANAEISKDFQGTPPGILFDTNLYAEAAVKAAEPTPEQKADPAFKAMGAMKEQGQDVGALMKLRRYMDWDEYEDYKEKMLADIADPAARKLAQQQFDEADDLYFMARSKLLLKAYAGDPAKLKEIQDIPLTTEGQRQLLDMADHLEHDKTKADKLMAANNAIYLDQMKEVRDLEAQYDAEPDPKKKIALLAKLKTLQADATFFAAEAYHSEGPLMHVVKANQSSKLEADGKDYTTKYLVDGVLPEALKDQPEKDKKADIEKMKNDKLAAMSANQMLQSFNENLGDLLKDLRHYSSDPFPGQGFYRSSKYIERLCESVGLIAAKVPDGARTVGAIPLGRGTPADVQRAMQNLVNIRGEKTTFDAADKEAEKQAYAVQEMTSAFPGVTTLPDLGKQLSDFGRKVNATVRSAIANDLTAANPSAYFAT